MEIIYAEYQQTESGTVSRNDIRYLSDAIGDKSLSLLLVQFLIRNLLDTSR